MTINQKQVVLSQASPKLISYLRKRDLKDLRKAFKPLVEARLGHPIRSVVTYDQTDRDLGGCNTCSYIIAVVDVYYKSWGGDLCVMTFDGYLRELINDLVSSSQV